MSRGKMSLRAIKQGAWGKDIQVRMERGNHNAVGSHTGHWFLVQIPGRKLWSEFQHRLQHNTSSSPSVAPMFS